MNSIYFLCLSIYGCDFMSLLQVCFVSSDASLISYAYNYFLIEEVKSKFSIFLESRDLSLLFDFDLPWPFDGFLFLWIY